MNNKHWHDKAAALINRKGPNGKFIIVTVAEMRAALEGAPTLIVDEWVHEIHRRKVVRGEVEIA